MNRSSWSVPALFFLLLFRWNAEAGDLAPSAPYVLLPPERAAWIVTVEGGGVNAAPNKPRLVEQRVTQTGSLLRIVEIWSDQNRSESWEIDGKWIVEDPRTHAMALFDPDHNASTGLALKDKIYDAKWIGGGAYVRTMRIDGRPCWVYRREATGTDADPKGALRPGEAAVDVETRLLTAYNTGDRICHIRYLPPPTSDLTLPPAYQEVWQKLQTDSNPLELQQPPSN